MLDKTHFSTSTPTCVRAKKQAVIGLLFTIVLATIFTLLQGMEYVEAPFNINDSVFGSCFYMATGFHCFYVFIGTCCLIISLLRIIYNHFTSTHHFGFESAVKAIINFFLRMLLP